MEKKSWKMQMISGNLEMCRDVGACVRMWEIDNLWISFIELENYVFRHEI